MLLPPWDRCYRQSQVYLPTSKRTKLSYVNQNKIKTLLICCCELNTPEQHGIKLVPSKRLELQYYHLTTEALAISCSTTADGNCTVVL
eukprot:gene4250-6576_t